MTRPSARKIARAIAETDAVAAHNAPDICPVCQRPIPTGAKSSKHHLTPKLKGGAHGETVHLHQICHSAIHARFSEAEIARHLSDVEALRSDPEMARFIAWVEDKPPTFHAATRMTRARRAQKRANRRA